MYGQEYGNTYTYVMDYGYLIVHAVKFIVGILFLKRGFLFPSYPWQRKQHTTLNQYCFGAKISFVSL